MPETIEMLSWHAVTSAVYRAEGAVHNNNSIYFLTDTGELFRGDVAFSESCIIYSGALPATPARKKIYVNSTNGEGKVYTGSEWVTVIKPVVDAVAADGTDPVNSKAVIKYVTDAINNLTGGSDIIAGVGYTKEGVKLTVTKGDASTEDLVLEGLGVSLKYTADTGVLELLDVTGNPLGTAINLGLDRFVKGAEYHQDTKTISLYFDEAKTDKLDIPVGDLVDTYTAKDTSTVHLTVTSNKFAAEVIVSAAEGNALQKTDDGLFVAATDLSSYMKLVETADATKIPMLNAQGQVINGTMTAGGEAIAKTPAATTLATELAVVALVNATKATIDEALAKKMALVENADTTKVPMLNAAGQIVNGTKSIGGATLAENPDANTLATEAAVVNAIDTEVADVLRDGDVATVIDATATNNKVASAKAVMDALTWKTTL